MESEENEPSNHFHREDLPGDSEPPCKKIKTETIKNDPLKDVTSVPTLFNTCHFTFYLKWQQHKADGYYLFCFGLFASVLWDITSVYCNWDILKIFKKNCKLEIAMSKYKITTVESVCNVLHLLTVLTPTRRFL